MATFDLPGKSTPQMGPLARPLKPRRRPAAARTEEALWNTIQQALDEIPPRARQNCIANGGYELT